MSKEYLLKVKNLSFFRNNDLIFKQLSFVLCPGELAFIDGENGAGKTSFLLCIANVLTDYTGSISIKNNVNNLGYVGHKNALNEIETVREFFSFWRQVYKYKKHYIHILKYFNLIEFMESPINILSFGQKKKLSFARLIMMNSQIWLLDEPISGLDKKTKRIIIDLIKKHIKKGGGVLVTSHQNLNYFDKKKTKRLNIG